MSEQLTGYMCAKIVNARLRKEGVDKHLPEQMLYSYIKKGYIESTLNSEHKRVVSREALDKWFVKYLKKAKLLAQLDD